MFPCASLLLITADGRITLCAITSRGADELGTFDDVRSAWAMVDRIDLGGHSVSDDRSDEIDHGDRTAATAVTAGRWQDAMRAA